jgi:CTP:molybdopterin cytidylyltransferase MocA
MITALILSAGSSRRMGSHKALLTIRGKTFIRHIVETLHSAGVNHTVLVLGSDHETIEKTLFWYTGDIVVNNSWEQGQLSSVITGLNHSDSSRSDGILICPVDHPLFSPELIQQLIHGWQSSGKPIVIPTVSGLRGHPILFSRSLFEEVRSAPPEIGLRAVIRNHADDLLEIATQEEGVRINIDTPEGYARYIMK